MVVGFVVGVGDGRVGVCGVVCGGEGIGDSGLFWCCFKVIGFGCVGSGGSMLLVLVVVGGVGGVSLLLVVVLNVVVVVMVKYY